MERFAVDGAEIEYEVRGEGEPVLLMHLSVIADGLAWPLVGQPELAAHYQLIHYHRRGYMGSTLGPEPLTMALQARDAAALLRHLGVRSAHVAGHSSGAGMALQLALDAPELVGSLALLEPALAMVADGAASMRRTIGPMLTAFNSGNKRQALELFGDAVFGPNWQPIVENAVPGGLEQAVKDLDTFVLELQGMQAWPFGRDQARMIRQPVLSVLGTRSDEFMQKGRALLHAWLPQTEDWDVPTTHLLQLHDPQSVAHGLAEFVARHPLAGSRAAAPAAERMKQSRGGR